MVRRLRVSAVAGWGCTRRLAGMGILFLAVASGCQTGSSGGVNPRAQAAPAASEAREADTAFTPVRLATAATAEPAPETRIDILLRVLHVQVPRSQRARANRIWSQLREDALDSQTVQRLSGNGLRVGVGRTERWDALEAALAEIEGVRRYDLPPLRTLPGVPLALELDSTPKDHTIFCLERDGIMSGDTWPKSQRVLRVTYELNTQDGHGIWLSIVPEVRRRAGPDWVRSEGVWTPGARREGRAFPAGSFAVSLAPSEFVLLAPGPKADVFGLVGGTFLKEQVEDQPYDSYVFVRADVTHVNQRR
jgi:hypothetical protein